LLIEPAAGRRSAVSFILDHSLSARPDAGPSRFATL